MLQNIQIELQDYINNRKCLENLALELNSEELKHAVFDMLEIEKQMAGQYGYIHPKTKWAEKSKSPSEGVITNKEEWLNECLQHVNEYITNINQWFANANHNH
ncbi:MAG: hypothetical protein IJ853_03885 [Rickettsiales bacterium]|nr:hypothetical protein [Rickettsiales bacterium]